MNYVERSESARMRFNATENFSSRVWPQLNTLRGGPSIFSLHRCVHENSRLVEQLLPSCAVAK